MCRVQVSSPRQRNTARLIDTEAYRPALYERPCTEGVLAGPPSSGQQSNRSNPRNGVGVALCHRPASKSLRAEAMERPAAGRGNSPPETAVEPPSGQRSRSLMVQDSTHIEGLLVGQERADVLFAESFARFGHDVASEHGVIVLMRTLTMGLAPHSIRVMASLPPDRIPQSRFRAEPGRSARNGHNSNMGLPGMLVAPSPALPRRADRRVR